MAHQQQKARTEFEAAQYEAAQQQSASIAAPPALVATTPAPVDIATALQNLGDLRTQGLLNDTEFEAAKQRLLR